MAKGSSGGFGQQIDIRIAAIVIALAIGIFGTIYYFMSRPEKSIVLPPTPEEATVMVLSGAIERVVESLTANGKAPKSMAELPPLPDGTAPINDGWNNEVLLKINGGGSRYVAEIRSKGADGVAGNDDDIVVDAEIDRPPNGGQFYVSKQSQRGGTPKTPEGEG